MRAYSFRFRSEAERQRDVERLERTHLAVEPLLSVRPMTVGPADARAHVRDTKTLHPSYGLVQTRVLEVKPLAEAERRRVRGELRQRELRRAVLTQQSHIEMT